MSTSRRVLLWLGTCAAFALVVVCWVAVPASAHTELVRTSPAAQTQAQTPPAEVVLTFSDRVLRVGSVVRVTDAAGTAVALGSPVTTGEQVSQRLAPEVATGPVTVVWRVVATDGHPIQGTFRFAVAGTGPTATAAPTPGASPDAPAGVSPDQVVSAGAESTAGSPGWLLPALVLVVGAGLAAAVFFTVRRRRS